MPDNVVEEIGQVPVVMRNQWMRERVQIVCGGGRTKTDQKDSTDINKIMAKYEQDGTILHRAKQTPTFGDFTSATDFMSAVLQVKEAEAQFSQLPAKIRDRCRNDPAVFLDWVYDPANAEELAELGLGRLSDALHGKKVSEDTSPPSKPDAGGGEEQTVIPGAEAPKKGSADAE